MYRLGLHTSEEKEAAFAFAHVAFQDGLKAKREGREDRVAYALGYLSALADLAQEEMAEDLWRDVAGLISRLKDGVRLSGRMGCPGRGRRGGRGRCACGC